MTRCTRCKKEITGEKFDRSIFIPPAILIPQKYCKDCFHLEKQNENELAPLMLLTLAFTLIPIIVILLA
ncbi:MAG: hypothetical protein ACFFC6_03760 [Promethearchaeota archaeon]